MKFTKRHNLPDYNCDIHHSVSYGNDVNIDSSGSIKIGKNTHLAHNVKIFTHNHTSLTGPIGGPKVGEAIACPLIIGENVFIGEGAVIMPQCNFIDD